jgi:hypothetical protein
MADSKAKVGHIQIRLTASCYAQVCKYFKTIFKEIKCARYGSVPCDPSTWEAEAEGSPCSRPAWAIQGDPASKKPPKNKKQ